MSSCTPEIQAQQLEALLRNPKQVKTFLEFLEIQHSSENLHFLLEVDKFSTLGNQEEIDQTAKIIFKTFIDTCSRKAVNVDSHIIEKIKSNLDKGPPFNSSMYHEAREQIFHLILFGPFQDIFFSQRI